MALGIPSGLGPQFALSVTPEKATAAAKARSYFYDLVENTPEEQRKAKYFELADQSIKVLGKETIRGELQTTQKSLERYLTQAGNPDDMGAQEKKDYEATVERRRKAIADLEKRLQQ